MDMRAEYHPSALLVDGCPVELSQGALEFFDEDASRYVIVPTQISWKLNLLIIKFTRNIDSAISFNQLLLFANISTLTAGNVSADNFCHDMLQQASCFHNACICSFVEYYPAAPIEEL